MNQEDLGEISEGMAYGLANYMPDPSPKAKKELLLKALRISKSGYGGILPNGNIVDRREHPEAIRIPKNTLFGVPSPKLFCLECKSEEVYFERYVPGKPKGGWYCQDCGCKCQPQN